MLIIDLACTRRYIVSIPYQKRLDNELSTINNIEARTHNIISLLNLQISEQQSVL